MQIIGRESGPAFFFFLDFFAGAASKIKKQSHYYNICKYNINFQDIKPTIMDKSLGTFLHFWGIFQFTNA